MVTAMLERTRRNGHNGRPMVGGSRRLRALALAVVVSVLSAGPAAASSLADAERAARVPRRGWMRAIERLVAGRPVGVAVREDGEFLYRHAAVRRRTPASNEKLLLSMALLDRLGPDATLVTQAAAAAPLDAGVVAGDLWILGSGDPDVRETTMRRLAQELVTAGLTHVAGSVRGSTSYFARDWFAPGWKSYFPRTQVALPTSLVFEGNQAGGTHVTDPELRAARALTAELRERGVVVAGKASAGDPPPALVTVTELESDRLAALLDVMNRYSSNFWAEVLGKRLGAESQGVPGSIAKGAAAIRAWAAQFGVVVKARDSSGLSYANRVSPAGLARLLDLMEDRPWGEDLREALPEGGQGTLRRRLQRVPVHAKTGTLSSVSALSGYVWLRRRNVWAEFSILSRLPKDAAVRIEDAIVRTLWRMAA
jgi:serine-type D-Ala-D-Ala carboxypeptidase/endopeptidase (penicillin-binding protein 4)